MKADGGLNIERLEVSPDQKQLLIGFRSPLRNGRALIARIENLAAVFDSDETPEIAPVVDELDLGGRGIRGLPYIPAMGAHLIIGGPATREEAAFDLWCWSGQPGGTRTPREDSGHVRPGQGRRGESGTHRRHGADHLRQRRREP